MLLDGRTFSAESQLQAQTCIVGTGMGALSVARVLIETGVDVLLIEAGPVTATRREPSAIEVENVGSSFRLHTSRGLEAGGGTALWHGICAQLDDIDFQKRAWVPHSGWPVSSNELAPYYRKAWKLLCGGDRSSDPGVAAGLAQQPEVADKLRSKVYQFLSPPFRGKDLLLNWCRQGRTRCVVHAVALKLVQDEAGRAQQLIVGSGERTFSVKADMFIVAAGALETPRLLLNSQTGFESGPGKNLWWLGRNLMDHPAAYLSQVVYHEPIAGHLFSGFDIGNGVKALPGYIIKNEEQHKHRLPNQAIFIRPGLDERKVPNPDLMSFLGIRGIRDLQWSHLKSLLSHRYVRWRVAHQRFQLDCRTRYGDLFFMTEQLPNPESRVDLSTQKRDRYGYPVARIDWQLSGEDVESFGRTLDLVMGSMGRHPRIKSIRKDKAEDWLDSLTSAAHHLGTARMGRSPADGVVDVNLKVFGTKNVWVCDGSVFPTAGSVNPSLTICALGHRLADHILAENSAILRKAGLFEESMLEQTPAC